MTGVDFQNRLNALKVDLQTTTGVVQANIAFRNPDNTVTNFIIEANNGVVNAAQVAAVQAFIDPLKPIADTYEDERIPVQDALTAFNAQRATHQSLIDAASAARTALNDALEADATYQNLQAMLEDARTQPSYVQAVEAYRVNNTSENFGNLGDAKGNYVVA